jgi:hypothetical protein
MPDLALNVGKNLTGIGLIPPPVQLLGCKPELNDQIARKILRLDLAAFALVVSFEPSEAELEVRAEVDRLAHQWFVDENAKQQILAMLAENKLDDYAIETEAMRIAAPDLKMFDRLEESGERRLHKTLRLLGDYRSGLGRQLHAAVERVIDGEVLALANAAKKPPAAA